MIASALRKYSHHDSMPIRAELKHMHHQSLPELVHEHINGFTNTFLSETQRPRWKALFALQEKRWGDIDVANFEPNRSQGLHYTITPRAHINDPVLHAYLENEVVILRLGHSRKTGVGFAPLRQALADCDVIFEGIISVVSGKLAIVINHDDQATLCEAISSGTPFDHQ